MNVNHTCKQEGCDQIAVWNYVPSKNDDQYYCDEHVSRGCSCHYRGSIEELPEGVENVDWKWIDQGVYYEQLNGEGKQMPCCEYDYDEKGHRKDFGEYDMAEQICEFIKSDKRNTYLENDFIRIYVRNAHHLIEGKITKTIDLGNIKIIDESLHNHGIFTELINSLQVCMNSQDLKLCIYVECIHNPAVIYVLNKFNFKRQGTDDFDINMYHL